MTTLLSSGLASAALAVAAMPLIGDLLMPKMRKGSGSKAMAKDIVMLHGANAGGWCFDRFRQACSRPRASPAMRPI